MGDGFNVNELGRHYKGDKKTDPYALFESMTSSNNLMIDHLRSAIVKRCARMYDKNQLLLDAKKIEYEAKKLREAVEKQIEFTENPTNVD